MTGKSKEELAALIDEAEWDWLRAHLERGGLILVAPGLSLEEAGMAIATDDAARVSRWIAEGALSKPTIQQIESWDGNRKKPFLTLIISPYVLIAEK